MGLFSRKKKEKKRKELTQACENQVNNLAPVRDKNIINKHLLSEKFAQEMVDALNGATIGQHQPLTEEKSLNHSTFERVQDGSKENTSREDQLNNAVRNGQVLLQLTLYAGVAALTIYLILAFLTLAMSIVAVVLLCIVPIALKALPHISETVRTVESAIDEVEEEEKKFGRKVQRVFQSQEQIEQDKRERFLKKLGKKLNENENLANIKLN